MSGRPGQAGGLQESPEKVFSLPCPTLGGSYKMDPLDFRFHSSLIGVQVDDEAVVGLMMRCSVTEIIPQHTLDIYFELAFLFRSCICPAVVYFY